MQLTTNAINSSLHEAHATVDQYLDTGRTPGIAATFAPNEVHTQRYKDLIKRASREDDSLISCAPPKGARKILTMAGISALNLDGRNGNLSVGPARNKELR